jgi:hypothetical protein
VGCQIGIPKIVARNGHTALSSVYYKKNPKAGKEASNQYFRRPISAKNLTDLPCVGCAGSLPSRIRRWAIASWMSALMIIGVAQRALGFDAVVEVESCILCLCFIVGCNIQKCSSFPFHLYKQQIQKCMFTHNGLKRLKHTGS